MGMLLSPRTRQRQLPSSQTSRPRQSCTGHRTRVGHLISPAAQALCPSRTCRLVLPGCMSPSGIWDLQAQAHDGTASSASPQDLRRLAADGNEDSPGHAMPKRRGLGDEMGEPRDGRWGSIESIPKPTAPLEREAGNFLASRSRLWIEPWLGTSRDEDEDVVTTDQT